MVDGYASTEIFSKQLKIRIFLLRSTHMTRCYLFATKWMKQMWSCIITNIDFPIFWWESFLTFLLLIVVFQNTLKYCITKDIPKNFQWRHITIHASHYQNLCCLIINITHHRMIVKVHVFIREIDLEFILHMVAAILLQNQNQNTEIYCRN